MSRGSLAICVWMHTSSTIPGAYGRPVYARRVLARWQKAAEPSTIGVRLDGTQHISSPRVLICSTLIKENYFTHEQSPQDEEDIMSSTKTVNAQKHAQTHIEKFYVNCHPAQEKARKSASCAKR